MTTYDPRATKKARLTVIRDNLQTNDRWLVHGLMAIYDRQTHSEQSMEATVEHNGVGFNGADANILSSFAKQYQQRKFLSDKQLGIARKKMKKYARQLDQIAQSRVVPTQQTLEV